MSLGKLTKVEVEPTAEALAEFEKFCFVPARPDAGKPTMIGYYDRRGKLRRVVMRYPDSCRAQINIDAEGYVTSATTSLQIKVKGRESDAKG